MFVSLKNRSTKTVEVCLQPQTLIDMTQKVKKEIKSKMRDTVIDFSAFTHELLLPSIGNSSSIAFSLEIVAMNWIFAASKTIAQIVLYNVNSLVRSNSTSTHQRQNMENSHIYCILA